MIDSFLDILNKIEQKIIPCIYPQFLVAVCNIKKGAHVLIKATSY